MIPGRPSGRLPEVRTKAGGALQIRSMKDLDPHLCEGLVHGANRWKVEGSCYLANREGLGRMLVFIKAEIHSAASLTQGR